MRLQEGISDEEQIAGSTARRGPKAAPDRSQCHSARAVTLPVIPYLSGLTDEKRQGEEHSRTETVDVDRIRGDVQLLQDELESAGLRSHLPEEPSAREALHDSVVREHLKPC
jgi:hypothetical protein